MMLSACLPMLIAGLTGLPAPADSVRTLTVDGLERSYRLHIPASHDPARPAPLVLALHPFATTARAFQFISGLDQTADRHGFILAYPEGTGPVLLRNWNEGMKGKTVDDVAFLSRVIDDVATVVAIDPARVYATGMSNGAMMCYRLASELSDRVAAVAPVAGTMVIDRITATRPVSVLHAHGTDDAMVPYRGPDATPPRFLSFRSVDDTVAAWVAFNGCPTMPIEDVLPDRSADDGTRIRSRRFGPGRDGAEVVLDLVEGGGRTWPGSSRNARFLGRTNLDLDYNERIWRFFERHPKP